MHNDPAAATAGNDQRKQRQRRYPPILPRRRESGRGSGLYRPPLRLIALVGLGILALLICSPASSLLFASDPVPSISHYPKTPQLLQWKPTADMDISPLYYGEILEASQAAFHAPAQPSEVLAFYSQDMQRRGWNLYYTDSEDGLENRYYFMYLTSTGWVFKTHTMHIVTVEVETASDLRTLVTLVKVVSK